VRLHGMASVQPPGFPVSVNVARFDVDGAPTDVVVSKYEDCVMLVASQIGAFGTILSARYALTQQQPLRLWVRRDMAAAGAPQARACTSCRPSNHSCPALLRITTWLNLGGRPDASAEGRTTYSTTVLLGKRDEPLLTLAARQLVEASVEAGNTRCAPSRRGGGGKLGWAVAPRSKPYRCSWR
jgi:hypothetical protein